MGNLKIGIFGTRRGLDIARDFMRLNCEIVALCDCRKEVLDSVAAQIGGSVAVYDDFYKFIEHDMDAVVLANYFNEHTPYAIECFKRNIHVYSECISNGTMAEGVELVKAFKDTKSIYFLAENYPQMIFNCEMKRVYESGLLGKLLYAEGEYNHPGDATDIENKKIHNYYPGHWRNYLPKTYYITHSLGPIMRITGATPKRVTAFSAFVGSSGKDIPTASKVGDSVSIITTQNDDGSIFRVTGHASFGGRHDSYRICGTEGQIENLRGMGNKVMLRLNAWSKPEGVNEISCYEPEWKDIYDIDESVIRQSGHGGSDLVTARMFVECIKENKQPECPFDLHSAVAMSSVALLAHRSVLEGGMPYDIPDFRNEEDCKKYENDRLSPFVKKDGSAPDMPCCSHPDFKPTDKQLELYEKLVMGK